MSILKNTRKRLFSLSKGSTPDAVSEEGEPRTIDDSVIRRSSIKSSNSFSSVDDKRKPTSYVFLQIGNPMRLWTELESFGDEDDIDLGSFEIEKVCKNNQTGVIASCKGIKKFSDDAFDDYLFEIGLLSVKYPRFEDYMAEVELLKELDHQNVVKFYEIFYFESKLWIMTEYCPHGSIEELIDDLNKPLTLNQLHYVARDVLLGLEFLNEKKRLLHRDLKSANLLIGQDLSIKIANFEMAAKNLNARSPKLISMNDKRYLFVKSPHYLAPEILKCDMYAINNYKSDMWSFGIVCIEMAEMLPPMSHIHPEAVIDQMKFAGWQPPRLSNLETWPADFSDMVTRCLNVKYDDRPTASDLLKHPFMVKTRPNRAQFEELLNERKACAYSQLKDRFENIESSINKLNKIRTEPDGFVRAYFDDLRVLIDEKAEEAKQRIEKERLKLLNSVKAHEEKCVKEVEPATKNQITALDKLNLKFKRDYDSWKDSFSSAVVNENAVHKAKNQLKHLKKQSEDRLNDLKLTVFKNKSFAFQARAKDGGRFGEIVIDDMSPNPEPSSTRRKSSATYVPADDDDEMNKNTSNRPKSSYLRIEIKPLIKKRYSIY